MKRAFTLIELLVVIAIIAILAAILFPVFAQAKVAAKKTQTLAQYKQLGTSAAIYLADYDDTFPLSGSFNAAGNYWRLGWPVPDSVLNAVPNGWTSSRSRDVEPRKSEEGLMVLNAMQPYMKNYGILAASGLPTFNYNSPQSTVAGAPRPELANVAYNGMLHAYNGTAINSISRLPMFWSGMWKQNVNGYALSNPQLDCVGGATELCRFNPTGSPSAAPSPTYGYVWYLVGTTSNFSVWQYGRTAVFVNADTSAKVHSFNAPMWPLYAENANSSPFSSFWSAGPPGAPYWMTDCVAPGATKGSMTYYPGFFRPDSEFNWTSAQCDFGGG
ncbi:prepilin-type N-terminal cleavage/methylation domain-containing protein [Kamptonema cortianum]|nr:prepilin-type N-terminal cleavage/methylation domain-containing protein [Geitlerinema splendidum]MDK3160461.1 prepilin-type N-terminal cleavage/methylation domain-containing protein [Kamptonema cortianum]